MAPLSPLPKVHQTINFPLGHGPHTLYLYFDVSESGFLPGFHHSWLEQWRTSSPFFLYPRLVLCYSALRSKGQVKSEGSMLDWLTAPNPSQAVPRRWASTWNCNKDFDSHPKSNRKLYKAQAAELQARIKNLKMMSLVGFSTGRSKSVLECRR